MFYVYVLESSSGKHYIGFTSKTPEERTLEHNQSKTRWTKHKGPWKLIYIESFTTKTEAKKRENQIKGYKGGNAFKNMLRKGAGAA